MKEDLLKIINHYGVSKQLKKLSEEIFELQEAILLDLNDQQSYDNILEEYADVQVVLSQIEEYFELDQNKLVEMQSFKINRTLERIKNETSTI